MANQNSFLSSLQEYGGAYQVAKQAKLSNEDLASLSKITVVNSDFGESMCFHTLAGTMKFVPLDKDSKLTAGQTVDPQSVTIKQLEKPGFSSILRADGSAID